MIKRIKINDILALLLLIIVIPGLWIAEGIGVISLKGTEVIGATIMAWCLVLQYYFRRKPPNGEK